jgi:hypothetical protein
MVEALAAKQDVVFALEIGTVDGEIELLKALAAKQDS